jgi:hypothetical protein
MGLRKKTKKISDSFVKVDKGSSMEDELAHFLNMDKEDTPKLLIENLGATKVGVNVSSKESSMRSRKKGYVYAGQKKMGIKMKGRNQSTSQGQVIQENIKEWLGKEIFKHVQKLSRSNSMSHTDLDFSRMEVNPDFFKTRTRKKIIIDSPSKSGKGGSYNELLEGFKTEMGGHLGASKMSVLPLRVVVIRNFYELWLIFRRNRKMMNL